MRYPASEKLEIIRLVEGSHLSARLTLAKLGIPRTTFYRWYDRYLQRDEAGSQDQSPKPKHVWNRVPDEVRRKVVKLALKETELEQESSTSSGLVTLDASQHQECCTCEWMLHQQ
jgi:transposase-like protein